MLSGAIVALDGSKIGKVTSAKTLAVSEIHHLVTDSIVNRQQLQRNAAAGVSRLTAC